MANVNTTAPMNFDEFVSMVPASWRTDAIIEALGGVDPIVFQTDHKPRVENIFAALRFFKPADTKVIIVGQDPYFQPKKAIGLAFGVGSNYEGDPLEGSLGNIKKAVEEQTGGALNDYSLQQWAQQGVLLLNRILTVGSVPLSHENHGWEQVTQQILMEAAKVKPIAMTWGFYASTAAAPMKGLGCKVYQCSHPSPHSARISFFKCPQFAETSDTVKWGEK